MTPSPMTQFLKNNRGNVAVIWALALLPILAVVGLTIDSQMAFSKKERVQYAADSAALAGARMLQSSNSQSQARAHAQTYFNSLVADQQGLECGTAEISYPGDDEIVAKVSCKQDTTLSHIIGRDYLDFNVVSTAVYGVGKLDVSFVFDISGSMGRYGRLDDLKAAAKDAVTTLLPAPGSSSDGDVRIAMVAYEQMIDAGKYFESVTGLKKKRYYSENYTETVKRQDCEWQCYPKWLSVCLFRREVCGDPYYEEVHHTSKSSAIESTCVYEREGTFKFDDKQPTQLRTPDLVDTLQEGQRRASTDSANADGYMTSVAYATYNESEEKWNRPEDTDCNGTAPLELGHNHTQIDHYIDSLRANGGTAGHQGIAWGWYLISPRWGDIFDNAAKPLPYDEPNATKAMIIMTDGEFLDEFHVSQGKSPEQAKELCDSIKEENIFVFTVAFQAPKAGEDLLEYCATSEAHAFKASNGAELKASYQSIATSISDLRIKS